MNKLSICLSQKIQRCPKVLNFLCRFAYKDGEDKMQCSCKEKAGDLYSYCGGRRAE